MSESVLPGYCERPVLQAYFDTDDAADIQVLP